MKNLIDRLEDMVIMLHLKPIPKTRKKILCRLPFFYRTVQIRYKQREGTVEKEELVLPSFAARATT